MRILILALSLFVLAGCENARLHVSSSEVNAWARAHAPYLPGGHSNGGQGGLQGGTQTIDGDEYYGVVIVEQSMPTDPGEQQEVAWFLIGLEPVDGPNLFRVGAIRSLWSTDLIRPKVDAWVDDLVDELRAAYPNRTLTRGIGVRIEDTFMLLSAE